jgi:hypothetical protein
MGIEFRPGRIYQVQAPVEQYREIQMGSASSSYWNALMTLDGMIQKTGAGGLGAIIPTRQPRSATEKAGEREQARQILGLYHLFYEDLLEQKSWLALMNMIQFYTSSTVEQILGARKFKKIITLTAIQLQGGGVGNRELRITPTPAPGYTLENEAVLRSLTRKEKVEIIEVSPQKLRDIKFNIKIGFEQEYSPETERLIFLDYIRMIISFFGQVQEGGIPLLSPRKMLYRIAEKFGENLSDIVNDEVLEDYWRESLGVPAQQGFPPAQPRALPMVEAENQRGRGMMFGAPGVGERMRREGIAQENLLLQ